MTGEAAKKIMERLIFLLSWIFLIFTFPVSLFFVFKTVMCYERGVVFRFGKLNGTPREAGLHFVMLFVDVMHVIDMRMVIMQVPPQDVLTKDAVSVTVDAVVFYYVYDVTLALVKVKEYKNASFCLATTIVRNVLGMYNVSEVLHNQELVTSTLTTCFDKITAEWGIHISRVQLTDVIVSEQLRRMMTAEIEAIRLARAKVIMAEAEMLASSSLRQATLMTADSPSALQLRYLQTMTAIAAENKSTILFPLPMDMTTVFEGAGDAGQPHKYRAGASHHSINQKEKEISNPTLCEQEEHVNRRGERCKRHALERKQHQDKPHE